MATNEELAVLIQGGAEEHIPQLWECSYSRSLRELMGGFGDLDVYGDGIKGVGVGHWKVTGESATERVAVRLMERGTS